MNSNLNFQESPNTQNPQQANADNYGMYNTSQDNLGSNNFGSSGRSNVNNQSIKFNIPSSESNNRSTAGGVSNSLGKGLLSKTELEPGTHHFKGNDYLHQDITRTNQQDAFTQMKNYNLIKPKIKSCIFDIKANNLASLYMQIIEMYNIVN